MSYESLPYTEKELRARYNIGPTPATRREYLQEQSRLRSEARIRQPSLQTLNEDESKVLRILIRQYDKTEDVRKQDFSEDEQKSLRSLEGLGFVRKRGERYIPTFVGSEAGERFPELRRRQGPARLTERYPPDFKLGKSSRAAPKRLRA